MTQSTARALKYPWALLDDRFVHISMATDPDVQASIEDGARFTCPSEHCGSELLTRALASTERRPHFAHPPGQDCGFNPETVVHLAAKAFLRERPEMWLPMLRSDPHNEGSRIVEPARLARWNVSDEEERILGRWRADIVLRDEIGDQMRTDVPAPFMIIEEEGLPPLVVEVVVTSRVDPGKITSVQAAGWRMLEIRLGVNALEYRNIGELVIRGADRRWLAHPSWKPVLEARRIEAEAKERERRARADVHIRRVQDKITAGRNLVHWDPTIITPLSVCALDNVLHPHVLVTTPYQHWMAAAREWWRVDLLRQAVFAAIHAGDEEPILPDPDMALEMVSGYALKLVATPTKAVLESMGIDRAGWGTPVDAVAAFLDSLVDTGFAEDEGGVRRINPYVVALAQRHHRIDRLLIPVFHLAATAPMAYGTLLRWKNGSPANGAPSRRSTIIDGGRGYDELLDGARRQHEQRFLAEDVDHDHEDPMTLKPVPKSRIPMPAAQMPEDAYLMAVREVESETTLATCMSDAAADAVEVPTDAQSPLASGTGGHDAVDETLVQELREVAAGRLRTRSGMPSDDMVDLFMNAMHPGLGRRPREHCTTRENLDECIALLKRRYR